VWGGHRKADRRPRTGSDRAHVRQHGLADLPVAAFVTDEVGHLVSGNPVFQRLLGESFTLRAQLESWAASVLRETDATAPHEVELVSDTHERLTFLAFVRRLEDARAQAGGSVVVLLDDTDRKRRERLERILAQGSRVLSSSFEVEQTLRELGRIIAEELGARCSIYLDAGTGLRPLGAATPGAPLGARSSWIPAGAEEPVPGELHAAIVEESHRTGKSVPGGDFEIAVPISGARSLGVLVLTASGGRAFDRTDLATVERLAASAASEIERSRLLRDAQHRAVEEEALRRAAAAVSGAYTIEEVIAQIADRAIEAIDADGAFVERIDIARDEVELVAASGVWTPEIGTRLPYAGSLAQEVIERARPILIEHAQRVDSLLLTRMRQAHGPSAVLVVPLRNAGEPIGCLILVRTRAHSAFLPDEVERAQAFGELAALAFRKIHLLEESERRRRDLERVTESKNSLMRGFSHDLKNPLGAADGYLALLQDQVSEGLDERQRSFLGRARRQLAAALDLIEDLGRLHREEAGYIPLTLAPVQMIDLVRELVESYHPQAELKGLELLLAHPERVPLLSSDANRIRQVLGNLISNAVKYTESGRVRIEIATSDFTGQGAGAEWLKVSVQDTGPGIAPDKQRLIFQEFARISPRAEHGSGLGLTISERIAGALGGEITLDSRVGEGSTFVLWLPITHEGAAPEPRSANLLQ
jgi:signal transduction histidine kinase